MKEYDDSFDQNTGLIKLQMQVLTHTAKFMVSKDQADEATKIFKESKTFMDRFKRQRHFE